MHDLHGFWSVNLELLLLQCLSGRSLTRERCILGKQFIDCHGRLKFIFRGKNPLLQIQELV